MIKLDKVSFSFPNKTLYDNISFELSATDHCAFIGSSGSGKSTLIDMLMHTDDYLYDGKIEVSDTMRYGYVSQFLELDQPETTTVFHYIADDFIALEKEIADICTSLETPDNMEEKLEAYQNAIDAFNAIDGDHYESTIEKKLGVAGLSKLRDLKISEISGGEFKLVQVIKEMLHQPDLLIMDEPDVFLDFENLNALIQLVNQHKKALLIITHNRFLLNHCFNKIIHLENHELQVYEGRYINYNYNLLQTKIELLEMAVADEEEIERNAKLIDRLRVIATMSSEASKGRALKARVKYQERLEARQVKPPFINIKQPFIRFNKVEAAENKVLEVSDLTLSFDEALLENVNFEILPGEKIALIGLNGTGKSTLFRAIFSNDSHHIKMDDSVTLSYLTQYQGEVFDESSSILDAFYDLDFETYGHIKSYLRGYGFEESYLKHIIGDLSGGEKNLLQLAKISAENANFLLLDEPTSHLDTYSQLALEKAINDYQGSILMISHDYYTITNCMDSVLFIDQGTIRKMKMKKFKRMIYANHFSRDYLENEQKKKELEIKIEHALKQNNFEQAKLVSEQLKTIIDQM